MKNLALVTDPIPNGYSVQMEVIKALSQYLKGKFNLTVLSTYIGDENALSLRGLGIRVKTNNKSTLQSALRYLNLSNESMLWLESWIKGAVLKANRLEVEGFDFVINLSYTIPTRCDIWWNQGLPLDLTVKYMKGSNYLIRLISSLRLEKPLLKVLRGFNLRLVREFRSLSRLMLTNSRYLKEVYSSMGIRVDGVVYTPRDLSRFRPAEKPTRDYILTYIGKETEVDTMLEIAKNAKVISFGAKLPIGTPISKIKERLNYLGFVDEATLSKLYSNALFTAYPFTNEPFGLIPLESMACGTPVLIEIVIL